MGIYDVPAAYLIEETASKLAGEMDEPAFASYAKSGVHRERAPQRNDWFYVRSASILYRAYKNGIVGTERLRSYYGGKRNRGLKREHQYKASGKVIRTSLQELEKAGYLERTQPKGRKITGKGMKLLNEMSKVAEKNWKDGKYKAVLKVEKAPNAKEERAEGKGNPENTKQERSGKNDKGGKK
jgi:small subunit ribosomal protein S19e